MSHERSVYMSVERYYRVFTPHKGVCVNVFRFVSFHIAMSMSLLLFFFRFSFMGFVPCSSYQLEPVDYLLQLRILKHANKVMTKTIKTPSVWYIIICYCCFFLLLLLSLFHHLYCESSVVSWSRVTYGDIICTTPRHTHIHTHTHAYTIKLLKWCHTTFGWASLSWQWRSGCDVSAQQQQKTDYRK